MEKPTKKEICITSAVIVLVFFAWLCRIFEIPFQGGYNLFRAVIYLAVLIYWGFTLHRRLIHPQVRHCAVSLDILLIVWFILRTIKYSMPDQFPDLIRYLWYLYYIPMLFVPALSLLMALTINLPETQRLSKKHNFLWFLATALFLLVITNDYHQLVFTFPDSQAVWTDNDYSYGAAYCVIAAYIALCNLTTLIMLVQKSRHPKSHRWAMLPCIPILLLLGYWILYIVHVGWIRYLFGDMTAVSCVLYAATFELCIRCGLIRSNSGYGELFRAGRIGAQITDARGTVCLSSADVTGPTKNQILKRKPIRFGYVLWREDVTELADAIEESEENCRDLKERSRIHRENLEADKTLYALQEKNRVEDLLSRETAGQLALIDKILSQYEQENDETTRRRLLAGACAVGAFIKRYGNLLLASERSDVADMADLIRCFEESFISLELMDVNCLCSLPQDLSIGIKDMMDIYRTFESVLEDGLFEIHDIWINGRRQQGQITVNLELVSDEETSHFTFQVAERWC